MLPVFYTWRNGDRTVDGFPSVTEFNFGCESRQRLNQLVWGRQKDLGIIWVKPPGEGLCHGLDLQSLLMIICGSRNTPSGQDGNGTGKDG